MPIQIALTAINNISQFETFRYSNKSKGRINSARKQSVSKTKSITPLYQFKGKQRFNKMKKAPKVATHDIKVVTISI